MEVKKNSIVNFRKFKGTFMLTGLVSVLGLLLVAFNWNSAAGTAGDLGHVMDVSIEEQMIQTQHREKIIPPPPPPPKKKVIEELTVVDDNQELEDELNIDTEANEETMIKQTTITIDEPIEEVEEEIFVNVKQMPEFPGGRLALFKYLSSETKYPHVAKINGIQGRVFVQFVVGKDGSINQVSILRGIAPSLDEEAMRVVKSMPKWKPGRQNGKRVLVRYRVPISFKLK